jgi:hypothetical protein
MKKLLFFFLTSNDRFFVYEKLIIELNKSKYKDYFSLLIVNSQNNFDEFKKYEKNIDINIVYSYIECDKSNYMPKVEYAIQYAKLNNYEYIFKCDNDIIIPIYTFDNIYENLYNLDNYDNLTLSPTISTGIPSVEYFIEDFFEKDEIIKIRNEFKKCKFENQMYISDYKPLNNFTINNDSDWDYKEYFNFLKYYDDNINNNSKYYKGIHPIRHGFGNDLINDLIINKKEKFFEEKKCNLIIDDKPYLCNMCFVIKTDVYDKIINKENLKIDGCDEVPINRYMWNNNLKHLILKNGFTIHITYNWRWYLNNVYGGNNIDLPKNTMLEYEKNFIDKLYS